MLTARFRRSFTGLAFSLFAGEPPGIDLRLRASMVPASNKQHDAHVT